jgi:hypothetical protein
MAVKAASSGSINQPSGGRSLITGKGGAVRTGGKMMDGSAGNTPNAAEGSSKVRLNGRMPAGDTGEQSFRDEGQTIGPKEYRAGSKQSFRPNKGGRVR